MTQFSKKIIMLHSDKAIHRKIMKAVRYRINSLKALRPERRSYGSSRILLEGCGVCAAVPKESDRLGMRPMCGYCPLQGCLSSSLYDTRSAMARAIVQFNHNNKSNRYFVARVKPIIDTHVKNLEGVYKDWKKDIIKIRNIQKQNDKRKNK